MQKKQDKDDSDISHFTSNMLVRSVGSEPDVFIDRQAKRNHVSFIEQEIDHYEVGI